MIKPRHSLPFYLIFILIFISVCSGTTLTLTPTYPNYTNLLPLTFTKGP